MDPIRFAIDRPIAVLAIVAMAVLFGVLALSRIPVQLAPDVRSPVIVVSTAWPGAAPVEIEREIVNPQEDVLRGLDGLEIMTSRSETGEAEITLEFAVGTDMSQTLLLVSNRLDRVEQLSRGIRHADAQHLRRGRQRDRLGAADRRARQRDAAAPVRRLRRGRDQGAPRTHRRGLRRERLRRGGARTPDRRAAGGPVALRADDSRDRVDAAAREHLDLGGRRRRGQAALRGAGRGRSQHARGDARRGAALPGPGRRRLTRSAPARRRGRGAVRLQGAAARGCGSAASRASPSTSCARAAPT